MENKTAKEILYDKLRQWAKINFSSSILEDRVASLWVMFEERDLAMEAMEEYAKQQSKKIAIEFREWYNEHALEHDFTAEKNHTDEELFEIFINQRTQ